MILLNPCPKYPTPPTPRAQPPALGVVGVGYFGQGLTKIILAANHKLGSQSRSQTVIQHGHIKGRLSDIKGRLADIKGQLADNKGRLADNKGRLAIPQYTIRDI
jgi:hypothetical protein